MNKIIYIIAAIIIIAIAAIAIAEVPIDEFIKDLFNRLENIKSQMEEIMKHPEDYEHAESLLKYLSIQKEQIAELLRNLLKGLI